MSFSEPGHRGPGRPGVPNPREAVWEATLALLAEKGLTGLKIHDVARRAGVATRTVYKLFGSREALLLEVTKETARKLERRVEDAFQQALADHFSGKRQTTDMVGEGCRVTFGSFFAFMAEHEAHFRILFSDGSGAVHGMAPVLERAYSDMARGIAQRLQLGQTIGAGRPMSDLELEVVSHSMVGAAVQVMRLALGRDDLDRAELVDMLVRQVVEGLRAH